MTRPGVVLALAAAALLAFAVGAGAQLGGDDARSGARARIEAGPGAPQPDAAGRSTPAECVARLRAASADAGEGAPRLVDVCADLAREIESGDWAPALAPIGPGELTARPFQDLVEVMAHYERRPYAAGLELEELDAVVESLRPFQPVAELSLWDRFRDWIRKQLGLDEPSSGGGLIEWLRSLSIPEEWARMIVYVIAVTIVIGVLVVAVNELRVSGVLGGDAGGRNGRTPRGEPAWVKRMPPTVEAVKRSPPARQPVLMLTLLLERLQGRFGERVRDSLTHRELASAAATLGVRTHGELEAVAGAAERVTYAGWRPEPAEVEPVIAQGLAVLDELDADREQDTANPR